MINIDRDKKEVNIKGNYEQLIHEFVSVLYIFFENNVFNNVDEAVDFVKMTGELVQDNKREMRAEE